MIVYVLEKCWIYPASGFDLEVWEIVKISQDLTILTGFHRWTRPFVEEAAGFPLLRKEGEEIWRISKHTTATQKLTPMSVQGKFSWKKSRSRT